MKIKIDKKSDFIRSWNIAERSAGASGSSNIFSTIRVKAGEMGVELMATDMKTSIICRADGVTVTEPGEAVIPIKGVSDLLRKAGADDFVIEISEGRARMIVGKSRYRFSTYPEGEFPKLPSSDSPDVKLFASVKVSDLVSAIERGSLCASSSDEFPQFLSCSQFERADDGYRVVSTDKKRLALARMSVMSEPDETPENLLLPLRSLRDLVRVLGMHGADDEITIRYDDSQCYFRSGTMEFAARRVESRFPQYANVIPTSFVTEARLDRSGLSDALERVDIVVRDYNKVVVLSVSRDGEATLSGRAPEFGEAVEKMPCAMSGDMMLIGMNTRFFIDAIKAMPSDSEIEIKYAGDGGHVIVTAPGKDDFFCLIAPVEVANDQLPESDEEMDGDLSDDGVEGDAL